MKIALVSHEYPPFQGGGIGTYATVMADAFARAGHEVHVVTNRWPGSQVAAHNQPVHRDGNLWVHRVNALTADWRPAPPHDRSGDLYRQLYDAWSPYLYYSELVSDALGSITAEHALDIVEFPECAAEGYGVIRRKRRRLAFTELPVTVTLHSPIWEIYHYNLYSKYNEGFQRRNAMEEFCIRHADAINAPSRLLAEIVYDRLELDRQALPFDVLPLPMDFAHLPETRAPSTTDDSEEPFLLFVGRLEPRKGVRYLVDAAVRLMDQHPTLAVHLAGRDCAAGERPGSMVRFLRRRIPAGIRERFIFHGLVPREKLFALYQAATACVFPAPWDNFPLTCVEAMACGGCVVASDYGGMAEMIEDGRSGLLFRARDVDSLTGAIRRVLENRALAATIRRRAAERIRDLCDPQRAVRDRIAHYERTIERHRAAAGRGCGGARLPRQRIALFVADPGDRDRVEASVRSAETAAHEARIGLEVTVGRAQDRSLDAEASPNGQRAASGQRSGPEPDDRTWLQGISANEPDFLIMLRAGDTVERQYFAETSRVMAREPDTAWVATWSLPVRDAVAAPYAGCDFSLPLDLLAYRPAPFALIRYQPFRDLGGWSFDLPPGWREWCLWLAAAQAGLRGVVVPCWLARHQPRPDLAAGAPGHIDLLSLMLDTVVERCPDVFEAHSTTLWRYRMVNSLTTLPPQSTTGVDPSAYWRHWWRLTKSCLKQQFPRSARAYRRLLKRNH